MEFDEVLRSRRSVRAFTDEPVSQEEIEILLEAAAWAPSPLNLQPWEFIVITEHKVKNKIVETAEAAKAAVVKAGGPEWAGKYPLGFLTAAPVLIAVLYSSHKGGLGQYFNQPLGAFAAASAAAQNLMLAAADLGLGSLWFTFFDPAEMAKILGVPDKLGVAGIIPLGRPAEEVKAPPRRPPKVHRNVYGG